MNRTVIFVTFSCLAALGITGAVLLMLYKPEQVQLFTGFLINLLGIVTLAAGTFYGLGKITNRVEQVQKQTNGTLTKLLEENSSKEEENRQLRERNVELETHSLYLPRKARQHVGKSETGN